MVSTVLEALIPAKQKPVEPFFIPENHTSHPVFGFPKMLQRIPCQYLFCVREQNTFNALNRKCDISYQALLYICIQPCSPQNAPIYSSLYVHLLLHLALAAAAAACRLHLTSVCIHQCSYSYTVGLTAMTGVMRTIRTTDSNAHHLHFCLCPESQTSLSPQWIVSTTIPAAIKGRFTIIKSNNPSLLKFIPRTPSSMMLKRTFLRAAGASGSRLPLAAWTRPLVPGPARPMRPPRPVWVGGPVSFKLKVVLMEPALLLLIGPLLVIRLLMRGVEESTRCCSSFANDGTPKTPSSTRIERSSSNNNSKSNRESFFFFFLPHRK